MKLPELRAPTPKEKELISKHIKTYYKSNKKYGKILNIIYLIFGIVFILNGLLNQGSSNDIMFSLVLVVIFILGEILIKRSINNQDKKIHIFDTSDFQVADGTATDITTNAEYPGVDNVRFCDKHGEIYPSIYRVRQEELETGTPLLFLYINKEKSPTGREFTRVFTPYMLTDEGIEKCSN